MSSNPTSFIEVHRHYYEADWPESKETITTRIDGHLADRLRAHFERDGIVLLHQHGQEGGYGDMSIEWDWTAWLTIGDVEVRRDDWGDFEEIRFKDVTAGETRGAFTRHMSGATSMVRFLIEVGA